MTGCVVLVMSSCHDKDTADYDVLVYVKVSLARHLKQCHICIKKCHNWANDT